MPEIRNYRVTSTLVCEVVASSISEAMEKARSGNEINKVVEVNVTDVTAGVKR